MKKTKVLFISSTGGHLSEMFQLKEMFKHYDYHIITEKTKNNLSLKNKYTNRISFLLYGTKHNLFTYPFIAIINFMLSIIFYFKYKPKFIITTGAHTCFPICVIGHVFGSKIIYIETFANMHTKTMTGKFIYKIADKFIVQWDNMLKLYPNATYGGWIY